MKTSDIRKTFLDYFKDKDHEIVPSSSLVSHDPTLLFTSAGMTQFKDQFLGKNLTYTRAATCQKCLRTGDLENVGKTPRHHTFFEMLGNFSFGDYFKKQAVQWAWEYLTKVLKLDKERLWISIYKDDEEAYNSWLAIKEISKDRIVKLTEKDNFWPSNAKTQGPNGPCGPCSEIFYDQGKEIGCGKKNCGPSCSCNRYVEIWNLVFTQYNRQEGGVLEPLPRKNIDTGMGLERIASVVQGVKSNFEIDIFKPIVGKIKKFSKIKQYDEDKISKVYAVADHIRAVVFAVNDGIAPSSDERGYVVRKLIGKAVRTGRKIGIENDFLYKLVPVVADSMKEIYPELIKKEKEIECIVKVEESKHDILSAEIIKKTKQKANFIIKRKNNQEKFEIKIEGNLIPGKEIFKLYDTNGIAYDIIEEAALERNFILDEKNFNKFMEEQKNRSRQKSKIEKSIFSNSAPYLEHLPKTKFIGYEKDCSESKVLALIKNGKIIKETQNKDEVVSVVLDKTPFYGQSGGQDGDTGRIFSDDMVFVVENTLEQDGFLVHEGKLQKGIIKQSGIVKTQIDNIRRQDIARNHTATHLLHSVLRNVLGTHVRQAGSLVNEEKLRFDFSHFKALTKKQLNQIEEQVNKKIWENLEINVSIVNKSEAEEKGALAFFKDKYKNKVRVINMDGFSIELCGGTHLKNSSEVGIFKIINESSVASGIRRIEAVTGRKAYLYLKENEKLILNLESMLKTKKEDLAETVSEKLEELKLLNTRVLNIKEKLWEQKAEQLKNNSSEFKGVKLIFFKLDSASIEDLGVFSDLVIQKCDSCVAVCGTVFKNKALLTVGVSKKISKKIHAQEIIKILAVLLEGSGGGKPVFAQAGGRKISGLNKIMDTGKEILKKYLEEKLS